MAWKSQQYKKYVDFLFSFTSVAILALASVRCAPGCQPFLLCSGLSTHHNGFVRRHSHEVCRPPRPCRRLSSHVCAIGCGEAACTAVEAARPSHAAASAVRVHSSRSSPVARLHDDAVEHLKKASPVSRREAGLPTPERQDHTDLGSSMRWCRRLPAHLPCRHIGRMCIVCT